MTNEAGFLRLDSDWAPTEGAAGTLTLTLTNLSDRPLQNFRLAFTSHCRLDPDCELQGANLVEQIYGYHMLEPPAGFLLARGSTWSVTADRLNYAPQHYADGLKNVYLVLEDGGIVPVASTPTTRNLESGVPRLGAPSGSRSRLPLGVPPVSILPFPMRIEVAGQRDPAGALYLLEGKHESELAFNAAGDLANRLFHSGPPLFGEVGGIACMARQADMAEEGYRIDFAANAVTVHAAGQKGFFYGFVTLGQILHAARDEPNEFTFPATGKIYDAPRFAWRGMLLDVARQIYEAKELLRVLDLLAWHKLNRFHLHLSDDEGWRLDIPGYPQLAKLAAWRGHGRAIPPLLGSPPECYGLVYSRADVAQLTGRAEQLFITIVPEIDIPGHSYSILQSIPELRDPAETGSYRGSPKNVLNPAIHKTYDFLQAVFDEVARLFPSVWIHVGGDEVSTDAWLDSPLSRALMREHGWYDIRRLQSYFLHCVQEMTRNLGRRTGAWEEAALWGGIDARDSYLVAWKRSANGLALAEQGYDVVLAPGEAYYLDMAQSEDWWEPGASWAGTVPLERCYTYNPGGDWPEEMKARLLGVQACLWGENLHDRRLFDSMVIPRLWAIAESAWTPSAGKNLSRFTALHALAPRIGTRVRAP